MGKKSTASRETAFRVFSLILSLVSILLFFWDVWMGVFSLITGILFLLFYCNWNKSLNEPWMAAIPCIPMIVYDIRRVFLFLKAGLHTKYDVWYTLEVLLLILTYLAAVVLVFTGYKIKWLRVSCLVMCGLCIALGVWDICDGTWVLFNRESLSIEYRLRNYFFYYIPDICFWIFPFAMIGSVAWHKRLF